MYQTVIAKFGGSSVADASAMQNCATIILNNPNVRVVVLSASSGVTNLLVELANGCELNKRNELLEQLKAIQYAILDNIENNSEVKQKIASILLNIEILSQAASLAKSDALTDQLVCHGEIMSTLLFTELLKAQSDAKIQWFDIRNVMLTDDRFGKAEPCLEQLRMRCAEQLQPLINQRCLIVTQGFIGKEAQERTTTLGRGGSDYTAALLAEALDAAQVDIWTDIPGIYTTDPRIVPDARRINAISFNEASEMATFGAKILHPATLLPAVRSEIPVFVGSSREPDAGGTLVCNKTANPPLFRALALRRRQTLLTLHSLDMLHARGFLARVFTILAKYNISVDLITTSEVNVAVTLDTTGSSTSGGSLLTRPLLDELSEVCRVEVEEGLALIAIIGNQLSQSKGVSNQVFGVLDDFNVRMICYGASSYNLCLLTPEHEAEAMIRTLHENLFI